MSLRLTRDEAIRFICLYKTLGLGFSDLLTGACCIHVPNSQAFEKIDFDYPFLPIGIWPLYHQLEQQVSQVTDFGDIDPVCIPLLHFLACFYEQEQLFDVLNSYLIEQLSNLTGIQDIELLDDLRMPLFVCACCGYATLRDIMDICKVCLWEDEGDRNLERVTSPNNVSLRQARESFERRATIYEQSSPVDPDVFRQYVRPADWQLRREMVDAPGGDYLERPDPKPTLNKSLQVLSAYFVLKLSEQELCDFINVKPKLSSNELEYQLFSSELKQPLLKGDLQSKDLNPACYFWAQSLYIRQFLKMSQPELLVLFTSFHQDAAEMIEGL